MLDSPAILTLRFTCSTLAALVDDWWSKIVISSPRSFSHGFPDFKVVHDFVKERQDKIICVVWHLEVVRLIEFLTDIPKLTSLVITSPLKPTHLRLLREKCPFISTLHCQKIRPLQQSFWKALVEFAYLRRLSEFCLYTVPPSQFCVAKWKSKSKAMHDFKKYCVRRRISSLLKDTNSII